MHYDSDDDKFYESDANAETNEIFNQLPQCAHTHAHTCTLTHLLEERHSINFIEEDLRYILGNISEKLYRFQIDFAELTSEEKELWLSFDIGDITFFLSGQRESTPEYTKFIRVSAATPTKLYSLNQSLLLLHRSLSNQHRQFNLSWHFFSGNCPLGSLSNQILQFVNTPCWALLLCQVLLSLTEPLVFSQGLSRANIRRKSFSHPHNDVPVLPVVAPAHHNGRGISVRQLACHHI